MRKVLIKESILKSGGVIEFTGNWKGPFYFHGWGTFKGDSMALLEDAKTGECSMAPPGFIKFELEPLMGPDTGAF